MIVVSAFFGGDAGSRLACKTDRLNHVGQLVGHLAEGVGAVNPVVHVAGDGQGLAPVDGVSDLCATHALSIKHTPRLQ